MANMSKIRPKLELLPHKPGSYQMRDINNNIIYVGKAKDLKNRVSSYFTGRVTGKTKKLVENIDDFTYIVTSSELESFLLEINLIKQYDPKYNILLRDDKSYPYIQYTRKPYPTLKVVRYLNIRKKDSKNLFGPFVNATAARKIVELMNRLYQLKQKMVVRMGKLVKYFDAGKYAYSGELHKWMYDSYTLTNLLENNGFDAIEIMKCNESRIDSWTDFGIEINNDGTEYKPSCLYVEGVLK